MPKHSILTSFTRTVDTVRDCSVKKFTKPSKVVASLSYATDINTIYKNYCRTGQLPLNGAQPIYDENFVSYNDLIEASRICEDAKTYFSTLPAEIKNHYGNDIFKFVKGLNSQDQFLIDKGLLQLPVAAATVDEFGNKISVSVEKPLPEAPIVVSDTVTNGSSERTSPKSA